MKNKTQAPTGSFATTKKTGLLVIFLCLFGKLNAQTDYRPGYILTLSSVLDRIFTPFKVDKNPKQLDTIEFCGLYLITTVSINLFIILQRYEK